MVLIIVPKIHFDNHWVFCPHETFQHNTSEVTKWSSGPFPLTLYSLTLDYSISSSTHTGLPRRWKDWKCLLSLWQDLWVDSPRGSMSWHTASMRSSWPTVCSVDTPCSRWLMAEAVSPSSTASKDNVRSIHTWNINWNNHIAWVLIVRGEMKS